MSELDDARERLRQAIAEVAKAQSGQATAVTDYVVVAATVAMADGGEDGYLTDYPNAPHSTYGLVTILEDDLDGEDE